MLVGIKSWWAFVLLLLATALCVVTGTELAHTIGQGAVAGWYSILAANFVFTLLAIFLCGWLARTWALREDEFNRPLETLTLAVGVLGPLGAQGVSFSLSPTQSENVSIVAAYLIRKFPESGHDYYLQVIVATLFMALAVAVIAILISNDMDELVGRWLALVLEFLALLLLLASSLLLLPWVSVEPSSLRSVSEFGGFIVGQFLFLFFIAACVTLTIAILRTLPNAIRAAQAAAIPTLYTIGLIVAGAIAASFVFVMLSAVFGLIAKVAPFVGVASAVLIRTSEAAAGATWAAVSLGLTVGAWIVSALLVLGSRLN